MFRTLRAVGLAAAALMALSPAASVASAAWTDTVIQEHFGYSFPVEIDRCGTTWTGTYSNRGVAVLRLTGETTPPLAMFNYRTTIVWTDTADPDRTYTAVLEGMYRDISATLVEGTIYEFQAIEVGQPYTIRTPEGRIVMHDRGLIRWGFLVDTKGDNIGDNDEYVADLGGEFFGRFPSFDLTTEQFCAIVAEAAG